MMAISNYPCTEQYISEAAAHKGAQAQLRSAPPVKHGWLQVHHCRKCNYWHFISGLDLPEVYQRRQSRLPKPIAIR